MKHAGPGQIDLLQDMVNNAQAIAKQTGGDAVVFLGEPTDPIPQALILDRDLGAWARLIWCYFRQLSNSPAAPKAAGDYDSIRKMLGIGSRGTVADALQQLRITRWVTCLSLPDSSGRNVYTPNVYMLHNAPLSFSQALRLDPAYPEYIDRALSAQSVSVRELGRRMLDGAMADDPGDPAQGLRRRAGFAARGSASLWYQYQRAPEAKPKQLEIEAAVKSRKDRRQKPQDAEIQLDLHEDILQIDNAGLAHMIRMKVAKDLPVEMRQLYLDEIAVKVLEGACGKGKEIGNPVAYLNWMLNSYKDGNDPIDGRGFRLKQLIAEKQEREREEQVKARQSSERGQRLNEMRREHDRIENDLARGFLVEDEHKLIQRKEELRKKIIETKEWINAA